MRKIETIVPGMDRGDVAKINAAVMRLAGSRRPVIAIQGTLAKSKIAWKVATLSNAMLYRFLALADGVALGWNNQNQLCAFLCARGLIETVALYWDYVEQVEEMTRASNFTAINSLTENRMFGSRDKEWITWQPDPQAINVLSVIDKLDRKSRSGKFLSPVNQM